MASSDPISSSHPAPELDVVAVGHALVDVLSGVDDDFLASQGVAKGAMHLVDDDHSAQLYARMGPARETSGGSAANTAAGVVACGATAGFVGTVANDELGEIFRHDIVAAGVRFDTQPLQNNGATGRSLIMVTPDSERTMVTTIGAATNVSTSLLDDHVLQTTAITYVEGYLFDDNHPIDGWQRAIATIHAAGRQFAISLSDPFCVERHREKFLALLDGSVDICFGNSDEVRALFGVDDVEKATAMLAERCSVAAVTRGAAGSVVIAGDERVEVAAEPVTLIDTTGAGDLYAAGVLAGLAKGLGLADCAALGSKAAGAVVSQLGARLSGPVRLS